MARIFFWSADSSGCAYYRCELPGSTLADRGHDVLAATVMPEEWLHSADVIIGQRVCKPGPSSRWQRLAKAGRTKLVLEIDDDLFNVDSSNGQAWGFYSQSGVLDNLRANIAVADLVTVTTEPLAEVLRQYNPNVAVLPNCIPASLLAVLPPPVPEHAGVTIGWSGGASHALDLAELGSNLPRFMRRHPEASLHCMGDAKAATQLAKGVNDRSRFTPWVESVPEFHAAIDFDITLAPLRASVFNRSKSAIRCLEAAALGIPVVASDFGPYADFVRDGETGLLAHWPHQWMRHLRTLLDPVVRQELGTKARALAAEHTIEGNIELWERAYGL